MTLCIADIKGYPARLVQPSRRHVMQDDDVVQAIPDTGEFKFTRVLRATKLCAEEFTVLDVLKRVPDMDRKLLSSYLGIMAKHGALRIVGRVSEGNGGRPCVLYRGIAVDEAIESTRKRRLK